MIATIEPRQAAKNALFPPPAGPIELEMFSSVPGWAIVHAADNDHTAPLLRAGEVAVVECNGRKGWYPVEGGLFLIEYVSPPPSPAFGYERRVREIVQTCESTKGDGTWWAHPYCRSRGGRQVFVCSDGPYRDAVALADCLLGPVVGIYRPPALN